MSEEIKPCADRITEYLSSGGLFNPEHMDHEKVRDLLIACREELNRRSDSALAAEKSAREKAEAALAEAERERDDAKSQLDGFVTGNIWRSAESCDAMLAAKDARIADLSARLEEVCQALEAMQEFHDCMEAQRKDEPLPEGHDDVDEACGDGICYVVGAIITRGLEAAKRARLGSPSPVAALKEAVVDALDDINESVWADDEGNEASATAFLARAINKLSALVHAHSVARPGSASTERTKLSYLEVVKRAPRIDADDVIEHESPVAALKDKVVEGERDWIEEARKYIEEQMDRDDGNDRQECGCFWRKFTSAWGNPGHDCDSIKLIHSLAALAAAQAQEKP